jgi:hypothetical protein
LSWANWRSASSSAADRRLLSFDLLAGPLPSRQSQFERKKNNVFELFAARLSFDDWPVIFGNPEIESSLWMAD